MRWCDFAAECPDLAGIAQEWIVDQHILLLGTLRADGSPRISALECDLVGGDLMIGMIWRSAKARDLLRDPRMTVHSLPPGKDNPGGDLKLYGRALAVEGERKRAYEGRSSSGYSGARTSRTTASPWTWRARASCGSATGAGTSGGGGPAGRCASGACPTRRTSPWRSSRRVGADRAGAC
ncbi:MAG: pyridoxamine 5'-phosphate oxidase family protein [Micromonosporaceae bacterium]|nr:pyridoxamine 5'-phosphate oxidase family protein [Micromonosporaceae bacterium]